MRSRRGQLLGVGLLGLLAVATGALRAEEAPPAPATFREQSIYVPYEKLRRVFEREGRGVFLPYADFIRLWEAARAEEHTPPAVEPPVDSLVTEVAALARVARDVVTVKATVRIEVLREGWNEVPLGLGNVAVTRATLGGAPARLVAKAGQGLALLIQKNGKAPETLELELEFSRAIAKTPGRNSVEFAVPAAPVSRWEIQIAEPGVKVDVQPLLAATDVPPAAGAQETRVLAFVGPTPTVRIEWTPKAEGAKGLEALAAVQSQQRVVLDEGAMRVRAELIYTISRAELNELQVQVPAGYKVVNVFDPNVREWKVVDRAGTQEVTAQLFEPAKATQTLTLELERFVTEDQVTVPVVQALNVSQQQGTVVVRVAEGLRAEAVTRQGLLQLDAAELPAALKPERWDFAYRYAGLPFDLGFRIEKIRPHVLADVLVEAHVQPDDLVLDVLARLDVQRAGVFQFLLDIPEEYDVRFVRGTAAGSAPAAEVDSFHRVEGQASRVEVNLARQARGPVGIALQLERRLNEADLLTPTGHSVKLPLALPRLRRESVAREAGRLVVYGPENLRLNSLETKGLRLIPQAEAVAGMRSTQNPAAERPVLAFAYTEEPVTLVLDAERRTPHVTVRQFLQVRVDSGVARFDANLAYEVQYSGVKVLRVDVPAALASQIRVATPGIQQSAWEGTAEKLADGCVAWRLTGETEFLGARTIQFLWERKIDELRVGEGVQFEIPRLVPQGVDRAWGQVVLAKAEGVDIVPGEGRSGLRPIDPQYDLMPGFTVRDAAAAFEFHDAWALAVTVRRYEAQDVKATSIERAMVRMVLTRGDLTSVQALYRMRSARQRLVMRLPANTEFDIQPVSLNGRPVSLEHGEGQNYYVPLVTQAEGALFLLEVRYTVRGAGYRLEIPEFPDEPATQQVYLSAFYPVEYAYLGAVGPWDDEFVWSVSGLTSWPRPPRGNDRWLLEWVSEGVNMNRDALGGFVTDGQNVVYSALRPQGGASALHLRLLRRTWLNVAVLLAGMGIGFGLLGARAPRRFLVMGTVLAALLLLSVFTPSLTRALVTNASATGAVVVLIAWALYYFLRTRPAEAAARAAALPPSLPAGGPDTETGTGTDTDTLRDTGAGTAGNGASGTAEKGGPGDV